MGKQAKKIKNNIKPQPFFKNVIIQDNWTGQEHKFTPQQMKAVAEMVARARAEGQEKGREAAALEFVNWIGTINEIKGIGEQRARAIANHFLAYKPGGNK